MPIQTSDSFQAGKPEPVVEPVVEEAAPVFVSSVCGHQNKHYTGADDMTCVLTKGHIGNHQAPYVNRGMVEIAAWKDEAGYGSNR